MERGEMFPFTCILLVFVYEYHVASQNSSRYQISELSFRRTFGCACCDFDLKVFPGNYHAIITKNNAYFWYRYQTHTHI